MKSDRQPRSGLAGRAPYGTRDISPRAQSSAPNHRGGNVAVLMPLTPQSLGVPVLAAESFAPITRSKRPPQRILCPGTGFDGSLRSRLRGIRRRREMRWISALHKTGQVSPSSGWGGSPNQVGRHRQPDAGSWRGIIGAPLVAMPTRRTVRGGVRPAGRGGSLGRSPGSPTHKIEHLLQIG